MLPKQTRSRTIGDERFYDIRLDKTFDVVVCSMPPQRLKSKIEKNLD